MFSQFCALPVAGEAYLLQYGRWKALIDGGWGVRPLLRALQPFGHPLELHAVICTHNDQDHAGGLTGLLGSPRSPKVGEFWLPGSWSSRMDDLLLRPSHFIKELRREIFEKFASDILRASESPQLAERETIFGSEVSNTVFEALITENAGSSRELDSPHDSEQRGRHSEPQTLAHESDWLRILRSQVRNRAVAEELSVPPLSRIDDGQQFPLNERRKLYNVLHRSIEAAERIRAIAYQAMVYDIPIRWFDFSSFKKIGRQRGGWPYRLVPVNSRELIDPRIPGLDRLTYLALTTVNRESLVFYFVESGHKPGALFCADSPMHFEDLPSVNWLCQFPQPELPIIVTAPHHGRCSNKSAYPYIDHWLNSEAAPIWIRAGGQLRWPCLELRRRTPRYCTQCKASSCSTLRMQHFVSCSCHPRWLHVFGTPCRC